MSILRSYIFTLCAIGAVAQICGGACAAHAEPNDSATSAPSTALTRATSESCINALVPRETLAELAALRRVADDRAVTALEREARGQDLDSRLAAVLAEAQARGMTLGIDALWAAVVGHETNMASNITVFPMPVPIIEPFTVQVVGRDLQQVLRHEAARIGNEGLMAGIDRGFIESFQFKSVPAYTKSDVDSVREPFEIQVTPVTQGQLMVWRYATGAIDAKHLPLHRGKLDDGATDHIDLGDGITMNYDHPGENMSYNDAVAMAAWLNNVLAIKVAGCSYGVITEPQYLHALHWAFGEEWDGISEKVTFLTETLIKRHAVYFNNPKGWQSIAVSKQEPSPMGLRHMVGNVFTWTSTEVMGASWGSSRVFRGGSRNTTADEIQVACRGSDHPVKRSHDLGFRLVRHCP